MLHLLAPWGPTIQSSELCTNVHLSRPLVRFCLLDGWLLFWALLSSTYTVIFLSSSMLRDHMPHQVLRFLYVQCMYIVHVHICFLLLVNSLCSSFLCSVRSFLLTCWPSNYWIIICTVKYIDNFCVF
jgi:hypothetical protein